MLDNNTYTKLLDSLIGQYKKENRFLEFKSNYQSPEKLGHYISALSNGACLDHVDFGYLFFGVENNSLKIKGSQIEIWCNGSTTDSGSVSEGSSPSISTT